MSGGMHNFIRGMPLYALTPDGVQMWLSGGGQLGAGHLLNLSISICFHVEYFDVKLVTLGLSSRRCSVFQTS